MKEYHVSLWDTNSHKTVDVIRWCHETFGDVQYQKTWWVDRGFIFFADEARYNWYKLRWA